MLFLRSLTNSIERFFQVHLFNRQLTFLSNARLSYATIKEWKERISVFKFYILALFLIAIDQVTKYIVVSRMEIGEQLELIPNFLYFTSHRNSGAAWGMLEGQMWFFYIVTIIVVGVVVYFIQTNRDQPMLQLGFSFILGGAIGNFIDRILFQEVVDFIDVYIFGYNFPIFNIADSALTIGVILIIILILFEDYSGKGKVKNG
ncbi:signal peptidase II [Allobacillus halotolerans]|uniref:Lipoprotein signal peptidase n=1 Tax=Allobacillus halotolerans TaxID=570278 RepID=A0ABS6GQZ2_9BACI|nr:signal peptidase II [Allobacillus halotolerans]